MLSFFQAHQPFIVNTFREQDAARSVLLEQEKEKKRLIEEKRKEMLEADNRQEAAREGQRREQLRQYAEHERLKREEEENRAIVEVETNPTTAVFDSSPSPYPKDIEAIGVVDSPLRETRRSGNLEKLQNGIAKLLRFSDAADLLENDLSLSNIVTKACEKYKWYSNGALLGDLDWEKEAIHHPWKAVFDKVVFPKLDEAQKSALNLRKKEGLEALSEPPVTTTLTNANVDLIVHDFLVANAMRDYTYNQIADELEADWKIVSQACQRLVRDIDSGVVQIPRKTKTETKVREVFRYAPARKQIDTGARSGDEVVRDVLLSLIEENPAQSGRRLKALVRKEIVSVANGVVQAILADLVENGSVICKPGPRRSNLHSIARES